MITPTVSVIMPLYNAEKYVEQAIRSVISQTYKDWEMIVVDDCSSDSSVVIVERIAKEDERITLLQTEKPSGSPTLPRNMAIKVARGRFIAFLDSDDVWKPEKLEEQLPLFDGKDTKIVFSYYQKMESNGVVRKGVVKSPAKVDYSELLKGNVIGNLTGIYDTQIAGKHYFEYVGHEDYVYWLHILRDGGVAVNTQKVHALYRLTQNSISRNKLKVCLWDWYIYRHIEKLSVLKSMYCFCCYAINGFIKSQI